MKKINILIIILYTVLISPIYADTKNCNEFKKTTKEYAKCTSGKIKNKLQKFKFTETLLKFKNSKSHKEFSEK